MNGVQNLAIASGASISTADGALTILANQGPTPQSGNFSGIDIDGSTVETTGAGAIVLQSRGGNDTTTGFHIGVNIHNGSTVQSAGTGTITITGIGGQGGTMNAGVNLHDGNTLVTSVTGAITITGTGGTGSAEFNNGVFINAGAQVTSTGMGLLAAPITITGMGGQGSHDNDGVFLEDGSTLVTAVDGAITITGTGGTSSGLFSEGVLLLSDSAVSSTGNASIRITGHGGTGAGVNNGVTMIFSTTVTSVAGAITISGTAGDGRAVQIGDSAQIKTTNAPITFTADNLEFDPGISVSAPGNVVTLQPLTPNTPIDLGGSNGLAVSAAELNLITAGILRIGNSAAGNIAVSAAIAPANTSVLSLLTGGKITESSTVTANQLRIQAAGSVSLDNGNSVATLAADVDGSFAFNNVTGLTIGAVDSAAGVRADGDISIIANGLLTLDNQEFVTTTDGTVGLSASGVTENPASLVAARGLVLHGTGTFDLGQTNFIAQLAAKTIGPITLLANPDLVITIISNTAGVNTGGGNLSIRGDQSLSLAAPIQAGAGTVTLTFLSGTVTDISAGAAVSAANLDIRGRGIGSAAAPLKTAVGTLASSAFSGGVFVANTGALTIGAVTISGINSSGPISVSASGNLTVSQPVTTATTSGNDVTLAGNGTININAPLTGSTATVSGGPGADTFNIAPNATFTTPLTVNGGLPTPPANPGDALNINFAGVTTPLLTQTFSAKTGFSGSWTFGNAAAVNFTGIESLVPQTNNLGDQTLSYRQNSFAAPVTTGSTFLFAGSMAYFFKVNLNLQFAGSFFQNFSGSNERLAAG